MRKLFMRVVAMGTAGGLACAAWGGGIAVGYRQLGVVDVPDGAVSNVDCVVLGDQSALYKTGAGTLAVPGGALKPVADRRLTVLEGSVSVTASADADFTRPPAVCDLAAFWVTPASVATTNGAAAAGETPPVYAARWLDARETSPDSPVRYYAVPRWCTSTANPATHVGIDPVPATFDGRDGVYFGGRLSGQYMRWHKSGAEAEIDSIRHLFVVHAITNCIGHPVGYEGGNRIGPYLNTIEKATVAYGDTVPMAYSRADIAKPAASARYFLDGEKVDARYTPAKRAWQLWEIDYHDVLPTANDFGRCGFNEGTILGTQGGDYLGEILVFTNRLSEAERAAVERYLLAKWDLPQVKSFETRPPCTELALAEGASATVTGVDGTVTPPLSLAGAGTATKDGAGVLALGPTDGLAFTGDFIWNAGKVRLQGGNLPPLAVRAGEKYAFANYDATAAPSMSGDIRSGLTCTKTADAGAGTVETTGNGWLRVHTVSNDVKKIKVGMGTANLGSVLQLEGRVRAAAAPSAGGARATFANPDLEIPFVIGQANFDRTVVTSGNTLNGWTSRAGAFCLMCTQAPRSANTWAQWVPVADVPRPGTNILQQVGAGAFSTTVSVPTPGIYELSFDAMSRYSYNFGTSVNNTKGTPYYYSDQQPQAEIYLGRTWETREKVGDMPMGCRRFERFRYRIEVPEAGNWELGFRTLDSGWDACLFMDNFEMTRVAEPTAEETFKIPNGSFDRLVRPASDISFVRPYVHGRFCTLNEIEGWTLSVAPGVRFAENLTNGVIGAVTGGTPVYKESTAMQAFPFAESVQGSAALMFAGTGGTASVTFTAPAGTWRLRMKAERWPTFYGSPEANLRDGIPAFKATLARGDGTTAELGSVKAATQEMLLRTWPAAFTTAADETVTLSVTQTASNGMGLVDDLELVKVETEDRGNLIANADFERDSNWTVYFVPDLPRTKYYWGGRFPMTVETKYRGYASSSGNYFLRLQNMRGAYQDVTVPQAGLHRFTMHVRARADGTWYANNPVRMWLAQGGTTNVLATTPTLYSRNWMEVSYLVDVPAAGTWRLGIEGRCRPEVIERENAGGANADLDAYIDDISLVRCRDTVDAAPTLPHDLKIEVAEGAQLLLDFTGTAKCGPVTYDGVTYTGTIDATTHPEFVTGGGTLEAMALGTMLLFR